MYVTALKYLARVVPPGTLAPHAKEFDNTVIRTASEKLGLPPSLDNAALLPLSLPIRLGGFGFRSVRLASPAAYWASPLPALSLTFWSLFPTVIVSSVVNSKLTSLRM